MADGARAVTDERLQLARSLLGHLEAGNEQGAAAVIAELAGQRDNLLYEEVVRLTRELQDSLSSFVHDERLIDLAETEVPDAAQRLRYVIAATEEAANTTLGAVEASIPLADALRSEARHLAGQWDRFRSRQPPLEDFRELSSELSNFLLVTQANSEALHEKLSDVLLAQGYQDLTGQVIRKVIALVNDVEGKLVELVRLSGHRPRQVTDGATGGQDISPRGPAVPGVDRGDIVTGQDDVDDLLSSLGF